jgi:hypothetical protein
MDSAQPGLVMTVDEPLELQLTRSMDAGR